MQAVPTICLDAVVFRQSDNKLNEHLKVKLVFKKIGQYEREI